MNNDSILLQFASVDSASQVFSQEAKTLDETLQRLRNATDTLLSSGLQGDYVRGYQSLCANMEQMLQQSTTHVDQVGRALSWTSAQFQDLDQQGSNLFVNGNASGESYMNPFQPGQIDPRLPLWLGAIGGGFVTMPYLIKRDGFGGEGGDSNISDLLFGGKSNGEYGAYSYDTDLLTIVNSGKGIGDMIYDKFLKQGVTSILDAGGNWVLSNGGEWLASHGISDLAVGQATKVMGTVVSSAGAGAIGGALDFLIDPDPTHKTLARLAGDVAGSAAVGLAVTGVAAVAVAGLAAIGAPAIGTTAVVAAGISTVMAVGQLAGHASAEVIKANADWLSNGSPAVASEIKNTATKFETSLTDANPTNFAENAFSDLFSGNGQQVGNDAAKFANGVAGTVTNGVAMVSDAAEGLASHVLGIPVSTIQNDVNQDVNNAANFVKGLFGF